MFLHRRQSLCLWGSLALAMLGPAVASEPLTLSQILDLTLKNNPELVAARAQVQGAEGDLITAKAYPNPEIQMGAGESVARDAGVLRGALGGVDIAQPIELPYVRRPRREAGEAGVEAASASYRVVSLNVLTRVKQAFYNVLRQQELLRMTEANRELLESIRDKIRLRVEVGESSRYELVKAEAELLGATKNRESAALRVEQAKTALRAFIGGALPPKIEIAGELPSEIPPPDLDKLRDSVLQNHPALVQARAEVDRAKSQLELEQALRYPQPTIKAGVYREPHLEQWRVDLIVPLPLWNQRQGPIARAAADRARADALANQQQLSLVYELDTAITAFRIASQQIETFESGLLREAESALKVAEAAYRLGERGILDYLDAQRTFQAVRVDYINALFDKNAALLEIERLRAQDYQDQPL
ncbi:MULTISPECIES: TolC family protein [unclassified Methylocaldum]|jgi:cobalt-zinc-cadmium efflux system outer membrane protein|uniref:TolC family protein n=1 Tax=unclassified Methylocaldum TaxID=2622260 RepID=UPI000A321CAC|nr:TolC family protein [Methylocaldum sp. RMAD-M]MBP1148385.1 cobalt-zinc-cadmium efflux system outer membrane protein [Methylocaldum sp. RMAD-M]MDV3242792.1 TolC family protein [Methylocaldum sp.]MVF22871.1 TolC family protein [Methylocaldum sp. BRCS4]